MKVKVLNWKRSKPPVIVRWEYANLLKERLFWKSLALLIRRNNVFSVNETCNKYFSVLWKIPTHILWQNLLREATGWGTITHKLFSSAANQSWPQKSFLLHKTGSYNKKYIATRFRIFFYCSPVALTLKFLLSMSLLFPAYFNEIQLGHEYIISSLSNSFLRLVSQRLDWNYFQDSN